MKKNQKGFMGIGIILAVIAVLAVGGIAYYVGTKNNSVSQNIQVDNYQPTIDTTTKNTTSTSTIVTDVPVLGYITSNQVGLFHIGEPAPDETSLSQAKYSIKEITVFREGNPQKQFVVFKNGKDLLTFELPPNLSNIGDITVISPEFKTKEGIGIGSTIADFIKAYPNYKLWYSGEEGEHFVLNTSNSKASPQFLLDRSGLINPDENFYYPTRRQAKISDFKTSAKIVSVRVYFSP